MKITGYGCEIEWDGATLVARGSNKVRADIGERNRADSGLRAVPQSE